MLKSIHLEPLIPRLYYPHLHSDSPTGANLLLKDRSPLMVAGPRSPPGLVPAIKQSRVNRGNSIVYNIGTRTGWISPPWVQQGLPRRH